MKTVYALFYLACICLAFNIGTDGGVVYRNVDGKQVVYQGTLFDNFQCVEVVVLQNRRYAYFTAEKINPAYFKMIGDDKEMLKFLTKISNEADTIKDIYTAQRFLDTKIKEKGYNIGSTILKHKKI